MNRQTDVTKLIATFRNFANAPIKIECSPVQHEPTGPADRHTQFPLEYEVKTNFKA